MYVCIVEVCEAENDTVWNIAWPDTPVGSSALQKCPGLSESIGEEVVGHIVCNAINIYRISLYKCPGFYFFPRSFDPAYK